MTATRVEGPSAQPAGQDDRSESRLPFRHVPVDSGVTAFVRDGNGFIGWGESARLTVTGPDAAERIQRWCDERAVGNPQHIAFVSLGFGPDDESVAVVPAVLWQVEDGRLTTRITGSELPADQPEAPHEPGGVRLTGNLDHYRPAVREVLAQIASGHVEKVVLACVQQVETERSIDERHVLERLATEYPECATFAVAGLVGASPEMVVSRIGLDVVSQVLAGTGESARTHRGAADRLLHSEKDRAEHEFAVSSVRERLTDVADSVSAPRHPDVIALANVTHLATEVRAEFRHDAPTALDIAALLHPTAAVGGTPKDVALQLIGQLEEQPRGRYSAPVGWMNAGGDGEFVLALRCGMVSGTTASLMAGCGIVAGSDPDAELAEVGLKLTPMLTALGAEVRPAP